MDLGGRMAKTATENDPTPLPEVRLPTKKCVTVSSRPFDQVCDPVRMQGQQAYKSSLGRWLSTADMDVHATPDDPYYRLGSAHTCFYVQTCELVTRTSSRRAAAGASARSRHTHLGYLCTPETVSDTASCLPCPFPSFPFSPIFFFFSFREAGRRGWRLSQKGKTTKRFFVPRPKTKPRLGRLAQMPWAGTGDSVG